MSRVIFSYHNHQINPNVPKCQREVISKLTEIGFEVLYYTEDITPDKVLDYGVHYLLYEKQHDSILILDIDCIPLSKQALEYTFEQAEKGKLIGNIQRANHISNNEHLYIGPPAICFSKETFETMDKPSFEFTHRGDVGEEITYRAEEKGIELEYFLPTTIEGIPDCGHLWDLRDNMKFGIGTTYSNKDNQPMFYHLFESRFQQNVELFVKKCNNI